MQYQSDNVTTSGNADKQPLLKPAIVLALALSFALLAVIWHIHVGHTSPLLNFDAMQRAGGARQLVQTGQCATLTLRYWELVGHEHVARDRAWPAHIWSLGYPLLLAAGFALFGVTDSVVIGLPVLGYLACVVLVFVLGWRLWNLRVAALALVLLLAEAGLMRATVHGHVESVYIAFILAALLLLLSKRRILLAATAGGVMLGFAYFIRPTALAWLPMILLAGLFGMPALRRRAILAALGGLVVMLLANLALTRLLSPPPLPSTGPAISYSQWLLRDETPLAVTDALPFALSWQEILRQGPVVINKLLRGTYRAILEVGRLFPLNLLLLAPLGIVLGLKEQRKRLLVGALAATIVLGLGASMATAYWGMERYASNFLPLLSLFGGAGLLWAYEQARSHLAASGRVFFAMLVAFIIAAPFLGAVHGWRSVYRPPEGYYLSRQIEQVLPPGAIVASPMAVDISWHSGQRGIQIPLSFGPEQVLQIDRRLIKLDALVLREEAFPTGSMPQDVGDFRKVASATVPWRITKGYTEYHRYGVYLREPKH